MSEDIVFETTTKLDPDELLEFYQRQKHPTTHSHEKLQRMMENTFCFVTAHRDGELVGLARGVTDGLWGRLAECKSSTERNASACSAVLQLSLTPLPETHRSPEGPFGTGIGRVVEIPALRPLEDGRAISDAWRGVHVAFSLSEYACGTTAISNNVAPKIVLGPAASHFDFR